MVDKLQVETAYLEKLAVEQGEASAEIANAKAETSGLAYKLIWDHGLISAPFWTPFFKLEAERATACDNMVSVCDDLAAKLNDAAIALTATDAETGENLGNQMLRG
jgi:hypothetical protein